MTSGDSPLAPLRVPVFRRFWLAAVVSNAGTWMQTLAVPIAVHEATGKATWIGLIAMAGLVPSLLANIVSGSIADRFDRRLVLFVSQLVLAGTALVVWAIFGAERPSLPLLAAVIAGSSFVAGIGMTTWQSFVPSLVPRDLLPAAVRLNSLQFAMARAFGPLLAALTITQLGTRIAFVANAFSYLAVLAVLARLPSPPRKVGVATSPFRDIADGWRYVFSARSLALSPIFTMLTGVFGFAFVQLTAPITEALFERNRSTSTWLNVGFGIGGIIGMVLLAWMGERRRRSVVVPLALAAWGIGIGLIGLSPTFGGAVAAMAVVGIAQVTVASALNTALQVQVDDAFRGRAIGVYMAGVVGGTPVGALGFGWMIDAFGPRSALFTGSACLLASALVAPKLGLRFLDAPKPSGPPLFGARRSPQT